MNRVYIVVAINAICGGRTMIEASSDESGYKTLWSSATAENPTYTVADSEAGSHKFDSRVDISFENGRAIDMKFYETMQWWQKFMYLKRLECCLINCQNLQSWGYFIEDSVKGLENVVEESLYISVP